MEMSRIAVVAVGKWESRSDFQGGSAAVFSTAFCFARSGALERGGHGRALLRSDS
jgi:hypothetical protein